MQAYLCFKNFSKIIKKKQDISGPVFCASGNASVASVDQQSISSCLASGEQDIDGHAACVSEIVRVIDVDSSGANWDFSEYI